MLSNSRSHLSLFDSICLIVGIIVGVGIYEVAPNVASSASSVTVLFCLWIAGGLLSLAGALCYAELATTYPQSGGDIVYLNKAYGKWAGFLFGWTQLVVSRPGEIATMTLAFATVASTMLGDSGGTTTFLNVSILKWLASGAVLLLTVINLTGVRQEKWTQNLMTILKISGLIVILIIAYFFHQTTPVVDTSFKAGFPIRVALIMILFTYGGWMEIVYVTPEVKDPQKNVLKSILLGLSAVTLLYLLLNGAFLYTLGHAGMAGSKSIATDTVVSVIPQYAAPFIGVLICISALGSANGLIFTGSRISEALGREYPLFKKLQPTQTKEQTKKPTPVLAYLLQATIAIVLIFIFGSAIEAIIYMSAIVYTFYMATTLSVIVLRYKEPHLPRPYKVTGYPFTPILFAGVCLFLIHGAFVWKLNPSLASCGIALLGLPIYFWSRSVEK